MNVDKIKTMSRDECLELQDELVDLYFEEQITKEQRKEANQAINRRLEALARQSASVGAMTIKLAPTGGAAIRGIPGVNVKFGLTLRRETWNALKAHEAKLDQFYDDNEAEITRRQSLSKEEQEKLRQEAKKEREAKQKAAKQS